MKKVILLVFISFIFLCCRTDKKSVTKQDKPVMVEVENKKNEINLSIKTVDAFLNNYDNLEIQPREILVGDFFKLERVLIFHETDTKDVFLVIKLAKSLSKVVIENYKIIARTFPEYEDQIRKENSDRNLEFDSWYITPKQTEVNNNYFIVSKLTNDVKLYKKIILQQINLNSSEISPVKVTILDGLDYN